MSRYLEISQFRKSFDVVTNWVYYPIASYLCALFSFTAITPNVITIIAILFELAAVSLILYDFHIYKIMITILLQFGYIFDLIDGMLARYNKTGYYDPKRPSLKGYYLDSVSDHVLRFIIFGSLVYIYVLKFSNGWLLGLIFIIIHGILQTEHTLRLLILKHKRENGRKNNISLIGQVALLHNNVYLFYLIFIPLNRLDLFFIIYIVGGVLLVFKRIFQFLSQNETIF